MGKHAARPLHRDDACADVCLYIEASVGDPFTGWDLCTEFFTATDRLGLNYTPKNVMALVKLHLRMEWFRHATDP